MLTTSAEWLIWGAVRGSQRRGVVCFGGAELVVGLRVVVRSRPLEGGQNDESSVGLNE
jgi:hypothetical protein